MKSQTDHQKLNTQKRLKDHQKIGFSLYLFVFLGNKQLFCRVIWRNGTVQTTIKLHVEFEIAVASQCAQHFQIFIVLAVPVCMQANINATNMFSLWHWNSGKMTSANLITGYRQLQHPAKNGSKTKWLWACCFQGKMGLFCLLNASFRVRGGSRCET